MTQHRIRTALMDATVQIVARDGLDKLTTRSIATECDLHDTYIYRYFIDKEDLLARTFIREERKIVDYMMEHVKSKDRDEDSFREKMINLWRPLWEYLIENPNSCKFYARYYYSPHFTSDALADYQVNNSAVKEHFKSILPKGVDAEIIYRHNVDTLLHLAMRIAVGDYEYRDDLDEEIFDLMYSINESFIERRKNRKEKNG